MGEKRVSKNFDVAPGTVLSLHSQGCFVALLADTIHAGGFCFGKMEPLHVPPNKKSSKTKKNLKTSPDEMFQNHGLHFSFLCSDIAHNKAIQETNIILIEEAEEDYLPDENIMKILLESLFYWHPVFAPAKDTKTEAKAKNIKNKLNQDLKRKLSTCLSSKKAWNNFTL